MVTKCLEQHLAHSEGCVHVCCYDILVGFDGCREIVAMIQVSDNEGQTHRVAVGIKS